MNYSNILSCVFQTHFLVGLNFLSLNTAISPSDANILAVNVSQIFHSIAGIVGQFFCFSISSVQLLCTQTFALFLSCLIFMMMRSMDMATDFKIHTSFLCKMTVRVNTSCEVVFHPGNGKKSENLETAKLLICQNNPFLPFQSFYQPEQTYLPISLCILCFLRLYFECWEQKKLFY